MPSLGKTSYDCLLLMVMSIDIQSISSSTMIQKAKQLAATARLISLNRATFALLRFPLPDLGEKIKEGRVKKLYVKEGDRVD